MKEREAGSGTFARDSLMSRYLTPSKTTKENYQLGLASYTTDRSLAKKYFADALKPFLGKATKDSLSEIRYVKKELLGSLDYLGQIYLKSNDCPAAAAIFQYCAKFSKRYAVDDPNKFLQKAYDAENTFLNHIGIKVDDGIGNIRAETEGFQKEMATFRASIRESLGRYDNDMILPIRNDEMQDLFKQLYPTQKAEVTKSLGQITFEYYDDYSLKISERAALTESIYKQCTGFYVNHNESENGFVQRLITRCIDQLGKPPCEYAIVGLGSISGGKITHYSDVEFAILIEEGSELNKQYFRDLTKLLHIKVINLGETALRMMGIEELNNFKTGLEKDDWFWDDITPSGFGFDGPHWHACKTPLGRRRYPGRDDFELILTVDEMLQFQGEQQIKYAENWFSSDVYLVHALRHTMLIQGSQDLLEQYRDWIAAINSHYGSVIKARILKILASDIAKLGFKAKNEEGGKLYNVKQDMYRVIDTTVNLLSDYYGIMPETGEPQLTAWQAIKRMESHGIVSKTGAQHLTEAISIAAELRLAIYTYNGSQTENLSTYKIGLNSGGFSKNTFYFKNTAILHHVYHVMLRVQKLIADFCAKGAIIGMDLSKDELYDNSDHTKAMVHARFLDYAQALYYMKKAKELDPGNNKRLLEDYYNLCQKLRDKKGMYDIAQEICILGHFKYFHKKDKVNKIYLASGYSKLGFAYLELEKCLDASFCLQKSLYIGGKDSSNLEVASNFIGLAKTFHMLSKQKFLFDPVGRKAAIKKAEDWICKAKYIIGPSEKTDKLLWASIQDQLGELAFYIDDSERYFTEALSIRTAEYTRMKIPYHPSVATNYIKLSHVMYNEHSYTRAWDYAMKALQIQNVVYENFKNHQDIADSYHVLGKICLQLKQYDEAISYFEQTADILLATCKDGIYNLEQMTVNFNYLVQAYKAGSRDLDKLYGIWAVINIDKELAERGVFLFGDHGIEEEDVMDC